MGTPHATTMVFSFTEQAHTGSGMLCYQTAMKGETALRSLMAANTDTWAANTGVLVDKSCRERDTSYKSAMSANSLLRAKGLAWKATPAGTCRSGTRATKLMLERAVS